ncbi:hypothetical protein J4229_01905 [Candidatus Pacearchaeota archaeon]|nr:hypothetical protein [Candidatus Pacearchaeota archaeon]
MALLNEIKKMQSEGKTEQEIISSLRQQGIAPREIVEALSQSKIKGAVSGEVPQPEAEASIQNSQEIQQEPAQMMQTEQQYQQMQSQEFAPSQQMQEQQIQYPQEQQYPQTQQMQSMQQTQSQEYPEYQQQYPQEQYQQQSGGISSDTITEIAEQVVSEKFATIKKDMEKIIDLKTTTETKLSYLDSRLKKIEAIIDRLNLSIMQKVGDYMTNIDDIKKELIETQKSFKALAPSLSLDSTTRDKTQRRQHPQPEDSLN